MNQEDTFKLAAAIGNFTNSMAGIRDRLKVIADGERDTHRQVRHKQYGHLITDKKKLTLKEAQSIANHLVIAIENAINEFEENCPNY